MPKFYVTTGTPNPPRTSHLRELVVANDPEAAVGLAIRKALNLQGEVTIGRFIVVSERGFQEEEDDFESHAFLTDDLILQKDDMFL